MLLHRGLLALACLFLAASTTWAADDKLTIAHIKLRGDLDEMPTAADPLFGTQPEYFRTRLDRIARAKKDPNVKALYLHIDGLNIGWGKMNELRMAIADFQKSGKKVHAYLEDAGTFEYLVALACDEVVMPESGTLMLVGLHMEVMFYKDLLDKVGLKADMLQMGDFKGAAEPFTRSSMSPQLRQNLEAIVDDHFDRLCELVAQSRKGFTADKVKKLIDQGPFTARQAQKLGLIDRLVYQSDFEQSLVRQGTPEWKLTMDYAKEKPKEPSLLDLFKLMGPQTEPRLSARPKIAVIYAVGPIVSGKGGPSLFGGHSVGSATIVEALRRAEREPTVKAIVIRIDSPGGSALASDVIWNEIRRCKKPVIASMGDTAASGGYYISMGCRKIFAEPGTLTGSIGVVGGKIAYGGTLKMVGVNAEVISRGANAGINSSRDGFSESERKVMTALMKEVYDQFLDKALEGRRAAGKKMTREQLEELAGGRVWTGRQALANGLVDQLGTLDDAIAEAKTQAGMEKNDEVELLILPRPRSFLESLMDTEEGFPLPLSVRQQMQSLLALTPELASHLRQAEALLRLQKELVWAVVPYHHRVK